MQLTDEPDKRCYPLQDHLFCRSCHIQSLINMGCHPTNEIEVRVTPSYFHNLIKILCLDKIRQFLLINYANILFRLAEIVELFAQYSSQ